MNVHAGSKEQEKKETTLIKIARIDWMRGIGGEMSGSNIDESACSKQSAVAETGSSFYPFISSYSSASSFNSGFSLATQIRDRQHFFPLFNDIQSTQRQK